jgi:ABC-2 type transport system ATP-binding protein
MNDVITTRDFSKSFGAVLAVDRLDLTIRQGEMFGLVGPDGAGKTTAIRMLCGILAPSAGTATVLGHDIAREPDLVKKEIGYLSQRFSLYGDLTIDENIEFFAQINGVYDFRRQRDELLEFTRLTPFRGRLAEKLSGGMKQKLALACTLIHTPKLIFLDEPTTGVDPVSRRDFWRILQSLLSRGITIVMSTPYLDEAERCTRVALMNRGRAMVVSTPSEIKERMPGDVVEIVCYPVREGFQTLKRDPGSYEVQAFGDRLNVVVPRARHDIPVLEQLLRTAGVTIQGVRVIGPTLENVFISLLTRTDQKEAQV